MATKKTQPMYSYYANGKLLRLPFARSSSSRPKAPGKSARATRMGFKSSRAIPKSEIQTTVTRALASQKQRLCGDYPRFHDLGDAGRISAISGASSMIIPTETIIVETSTASDRAWLKNKYGMVVVQEGRHGKLLLAAPEGGDAGIGMVFEAARKVRARAAVSAAQPNFLRAINRPGPASGTRASIWNLENDGSPGIPGADVHAEAAWTISQGDADISIAVLDEGVDSRHSYLRPAIIAEGDFVDGNPHARPDGDDAHGTACAGIVASRHHRFRGLAPRCSLIGARIAKSDSDGFWIFDDFDTADAIDWCWDDAGADVLSNSWGGGPPSDVIIRSFARASTLGRRGKGAVVVVAAGNEGVPVDFPGNLPNVLTVGASNQWDKRKTKTSRDGEHWWASNFGPGLDIMAPGVKIPTTDIRGRKGYSNTLFTPNFNGTSSACPHVAAAAALVLSVAPGLREDQVRQLLLQQADSMTGSDRWDSKTGYGRLNAYAAMWKARRI